MRKDCGKIAGTVRGLSFKVVTLRRCCGNSAERLRKHCEHNAEHGRSRCGCYVGVYSWATIERVTPRGTVPGPSKNYPSTTSLVPKPSCTWTRLDCKLTWASSHIAWFIRYNLQVNPNHATHKFAGRKHIILITEQSQQCTSDHNKALWLNRFIKVRTGVHEMAVIGLFQTW